VETGGFSGQFQFACATNQRERRPKIHRQQLRRGDFGVF